MGAVAEVGRGKGGPVRLGRRPGEPNEVTLVYLRTERAAHVHVAVFDADGDGVTSTVGGHWHRIRGLEVQPAADGHTHELSTERAPVQEPRFYLHLLDELARREREKEEATCGH